MTEDEIDRVIEAIDQHKSFQSPATNKTDSKTDGNALDNENVFDNVDAIRDDGQYPVFPLVYPNNATYSPKTGEMHIDKNASRDKLKIYKPAK